MSQEHPANLLDLLDELLQLPIDQRRQRLTELSLPAEDRAKLEEWLDRAPQSREFLNAPSEMVQQASELLAGDDTHVKPTDSPSSLGAVSELLSAAPLPPQVTGYEIKGLLGHGGMATVWRAVQESTGRQVALKVMEPLLLASPRARARFDRELRLTARLEHPNVARVYEGGAAGSVCYCAMELIEGEPLDSYVQRNHLSARKILELMVLVCGGVRHAHQNGVIHRDLKPSNILVDAAGQPHVLDFGMARAIEESIADPAVTSDGSLAGTIAFMSPEQAKGQQAIGNRSDVYSLGVILYRLLTGQSPYDVIGPRDQVLRQIVEHVPSRPSRVRRDLDPDLDWIILKALEKDPARRYDAAHALAEDLGRYLRHDPVEASPPSVSYRVRKFARRHRLGLLVAGIASVLLITATVSSTWLAIRAVHARNAEAAERKQAEAIAQVLESVFNGIDPYDSSNGEVGLKGVLVERVDKAASALEKDAAGDPLVRAHLKVVLGSAQIGLGEPFKAETLLSSALADQKRYSRPDSIDTLETLNCLAVAYREAGRTADAVSIFERVLEQRTRKLGSNHEQTLVTIRDLSRTYALTGQYVKAVQLAEQLLAARMSKFGPDHDLTLDSEQRLATAYRFSRRYAEGIKLQEHVRDRRVLDHGVNDAHALDAMYALGILYYDARRNADAITSLEKVRSQRFRILGENHVDTLRATDSLALCYERAGRTLEAIALLELVRDQSINKLGPNHPETLTREAHLAGAYHSAGRSADAIKLLEAVKEKQIQHVGPFDHDTFGTLFNIGATYLAGGQDAKAMEFLEQARDGLSKYFGPDHTDTLVASYQLAVAYRRLGKFPQAAAVEANRLKYEPGNQQARYVLGCIQFYLNDQDAYRATRAELIKRFGSATDPGISDRTAKVCLLEPQAVTDLSPIIRLADQNVAPGSIRFLSYYQLTKGLLEYRRGNFDAAIDWLTRSREAFTRQLALPRSPNPNVYPNWNECQVTTSFLISMCHFRAGRTAQAAESLALARHQFATQILHLPSTGIRVGFEDWLIVHAIAREADALMGKEDPPAGAGNH